MEQPQVSQPSQQQDRGEQRKARRALTGFLQRLRKVCSTFNTVDEWTGFVSDLKDILDTFQEGIPTEHRQSLADAISPADLTSEGISRACQVLESRLENAIQALPKGGGCNCGCLALGVIGGLIGVIALILVAGALLFQPVDVVVVNEGCEPMAVRQGVPATFDPVLNLFRVRLPDRIETDSFEVIEVTGLPLTVKVDGTDRDQVRVSVLGLGQTFGSGDTTDVIVNGFSIFGTSRSVNVRGDAPHEVIISCR
jgi:hypothetical protein